MFHSEFGSSASSVISEISFISKLPSGWVTCELNNSSKTADPQDLIPSSGSQYYQMAETSHCTLEECTYKDGEEPYHIIARWFLDGADSDVSLFGGARYEEESGEKSLYLDGSGAHATTPAVDFNKTSFTIASWVKLQTPVNDPSPIYTDWSSNDEIKFLFIASEGKAKELRFGGFNQRSDWKPWLSGGSPPIDQWFQAAAVWDRQTSEVHLFLNSHKVGTQQVASDIFLAETSHTAYDIGLKRDNMGSLRGNLKNLTIISRALSVEEIANISGPVSAKILSFDTSMNWFAIIFLPCVAGCQTTKFVKEQDHALKNHVIKNVIAIQPLACVWQCVDTPLCFSMNIRSLPTGWVTCELNNSSKTADPQNVRFSPGTRYYQLAEVGHCTTEQCIYKDGENQQLDHVIKHWKLDESDGDVRSLPYDKWFHAAAVWDRDAHKAYLFLDGQEVGSQSVLSDAVPKDYDPSNIFDIGRKANTGKTLRGYLRDLMIIGSALTGEQIINKITEPSFDEAWIGFNDLDTEGTFHWLNGTRVTFTKWATGQPAAGTRHNVLFPNNNEDHDCVGMKFGEGTWNDIYFSRMEEIKQNRAIRVAIRALNIFSNLSKRNASKWGDTRQNLLLSLRLPKQHRAKAVQLYVLSNVGKDVIGHWILDGTDVDVSLFNGARYEEESTLGVKALYLDGLYAYATTPAVEFLRISFTMASWVKLEDPVRSPSTIYGYWKDPHLFRFTANLNNELQCEFHDHDAQGNLQGKIKFRAGTSKKDEWFLVAAAWDKTKKKAHLFLDGQRVGTHNGPGNFDPTEFKYTFFDIGLKRDGNHTLKGYLKNLIIVHSTLTGGEILSMTGKDVIGHWFLDGTDVDVSLFNGARYEEESTRAGKALYLDGLYAYGTTPAVKFLQSSFTLASWVKLEDLVRSPSTIYGYWKDPHLFRFTANLENKLHFQIKRGLQNLIELSAGSPTIDEWFLAAAVWDETKNEVYLYLNDSKVGNSGGPSNYNPPAYDYEFFDIGLKRDANHTMKGYLRNLMIVNSPLSTEEIFNMRDPNNEAFAGVWIGLNDVTTEGDFHWPDGSHVTYEKWHANEPNNTYKYQDCVQMLISDGTWDDTSCGKRLPFLCEKKH
ncbi:Aggrecan core protein [Stylophora pistillata]|uniref:Aggrecan core protein n=1 Tax=Stylophora pistillata TaxID=50429 RepID=A0A2B4SLC6_STYPI|nr:Aggrecan core protein [Stylophora pistillata]